MTKTYSAVVVGSVALLALGACGKKDDPLSFLSNHAVGTFIGGGSLSGPESCTYAGTPRVFLGNDGAPSS